MNTLNLLDNNKQNKILNQLKTLITLEHMPK